MTPLRAVSAEAARKLASAVAASTSTPGATSRAGRPWRKDDPRVGMGRHAVRVATLRGALDASG